MPVCAWEDCGLENVGNSKYCTAHKKAARERFRTNIANQQAEKAARDETFAAIWAEACAEAAVASQLAQPTPMQVQQRADVLDDTSPVVQAWNVPDGVCGFASVNVRPGNCAFANWLKKNTSHKYSSYHKAILIFMHYGNQSYERKTAAAHAMEKVFGHHGIRCSVDSRLD